MTSAATARNERADVRSQIRAFLSTRRAKITPLDAGLPAFRTERRRVAGLRREEVALLVGISVEYYAKLERGHATNISESVLDGLTNALRLNPAERAHLVVLLRAAGDPRKSRRRLTPSPIRPSIKRVLDAMQDAPAFVLNDRLDVLATNDMARALWSPVIETATGQVNNARFLFLNPEAVNFFRDWDRVADDTVALLRAEAGRHPFDRELSDLVGELSTRSADFATRWAAHDVRGHATGTKRLHHPVVGDLDLAFESFAFAGEEGRSLLIYTAEPSSSSNHALRLLASWSTTNQPLSVPTEAN